MNFTKKELECLKLYSLCADNTSLGTDKFQIKTLREDKGLALFQFSKDVILFTLFKDKKDGDLDFIFSSDGFGRMADCCGEDEKITITNDQVCFGVNSKYKFKREDIEQVGDIEPEKILEYIEGREKREKFILKDLSLINPIKPFIGQDELELIGFYSNHFIATDRFHGTAAMKTTSKIDGNIFLPSIVHSIISHCKINEMIIYVYDDIGKYLIQIKNSFIFIAIRDSRIIPNIFDPKIERLYNHPCTITVDKDKVQLALRRINEVADPLSENRIVIKFQHNKIILENEEVNLGTEEIQAEVENPLIGKEVVVSASYILSMVSNLDDKIFIKAPEDTKNVKLILLTNEDKSKMYLHNLYKNTREDIKVENNETK